MTALRSFCFALCLLCAAATAQEFAHPWDPRSGDAWIDRQLADVNRYAARYRDAFTDELVRYFDAPRGLVNELVVERRWSPGDVYYACAIARVAGRPCRAVADAWAQEYAGGWAPIAQRMGIAPGTSEALRLKLAFVDSYAHWARPVELDAGLARAMRDRAKASASAEAKARRDAEAKAKRAKPGARVADRMIDPADAEAAPRLTHRGGCHCGRVRFEVDAPARIEALACNCSICRMTGFIHLIVPAARFRLVSGEDALADYRFGTQVARHRFCRHCGIKPFYVPRSHPGGIDVDVRCIDDGTIVALSVSAFDDGDRDAATRALAHLTRR